jgi:enamine deaminase RidA (YjgF/YER057c/UK114 family)
MNIERYEAAELFSQVVVHGETVYLAGQVAAGDSVSEQMSGILAQIDQRLESVGSDRSKLLSATIWLTDIGTFGEMNEVWLRWVDPQDKPARATVEARLADPAFLVEVMVVAAREGRSGG